MHFGKCGLSIKFDLRVAFAFQPILAAVAQDQLCIGHGYCDPLQCLNIFDGADYFYRQSLANSRCAQENKASPLVDAPAVAICDLKGRTWPAPQISTVGLHRTQCHLGRYSAEPPARRAGECLCGARVRPAARIPGRERATGAIDESVGATHCKKSFGPRSRHRRDDRYAA